MKYSIGIDFGTESGRILIVDVKTGNIIKTFVYPFKNKVIYNNLLGNLVYCY